MGDGWWRQRCQNGDVWTHGRDKKLVIMFNLRKDYYAFLAHVVDKTQEVKSIKDIPEVCYFPEDLSGVPPECQVEF